MPSLLRIFGSALLAIGALCLFAGDASFNPFFDWAAWVLVAGALSVAAGAALGNRKKTGSS